MKIATACPRCGYSRCEWSEEELFCAHCLLHEDARTFKYREENPYQYLSSKLLTDQSFEEDTPFTHNLNPIPILEEFELHSFDENQIPQIDAN